jgi:DNA polymerase III epsilon subunit-like protein
MASTTNLESRIVAIDCEMIGVGRRSYLARVTIVDYNGNVIYDKLVKPPIIRNNTIKINYRTPISGVNEKMLKKGKSFNVVQSEVLSILESKVVLGHGLTNDFNALKIYDWRERYKYFDTTEIPFFMTILHREGHPDRLQPRKLKALAAEFLGKTIQVEGMPHDSAEDARTVVELYRTLPDKFVIPPPIAPPSIPVNTTTSSNINLGNKKGGREHTAPNVGNKARRQTRKRNSR